MHEKTPLITKSPLLQALTCGPVPHVNGKTSVSPLAPAKQAQGPVPQAEGTGRQGGPNQERANAHVHTPSSPTCTAPLNALAL